MITELIIVLTLPITLPVDRWLKRHGREGFSRVRDDRSGIKWSFDRQAFRRIP